MSYIEDYFPLFLKKRDWYPMSVSVGRSLILSSRLLNLSVLRYSVTTDSGRKLFSPQSFSMASSIASANIAAQDFHYFLVLDFEATCIKNGRLVPQEIIEFPVLKVSGRTFEVESEFHTYVEPQVHEVGEFCTELTGITKEMVAGKPHLPDVLEMFHDWMQKEDLLSNETKSIFVTCGEWDLKTMLPGQCEYCKLPIKPYFNQWINIKKPFARVTGEYSKGMMAMLERLDLKHVGRHHSGLDDCKNIAKILKAIAERKFRFIPTGAKR